MFYKTEKQYRIPGYDYSCGSYFITICSKDRKEIFGKINRKRIKLTDIGLITRNLWKEIPKIFLTVKLDTFVVMPNHFHGIINIGDNMDLPIDRGNLINCRDLINCRNLINQIPTGNHNNFSTDGQIHKFKSGIKNNPMELKYITLGRIIRWFKGKSIYKIHKTYAYAGPIWQSRFYDHIIRNNEEFENIRNYIINNPVNWVSDRNNLKV